eukprot:COSAG05_NODE_5314_length_1208_cov_11.223412_1_plen_88_part_00
MEDPPFFDGGYGGYGPWLHVRGEKVCEGKYCWVMLYLCSAHPATPALYLPAPPAPTLRAWLADALTRSRHDVLHGQVLHLGKAAAKG